MATVVSVRHMELTMADLTLRICCTHCNLDFDSRMLAFGDRQDFEEASFIDMEELCVLCNRLTKVTKKNTTLNLPTGVSEPD